jgi:hypothetical protein
MILTISNYLNARSGSPSVNAPTYAYKSPGDTISVDQVVAGDLVSGGTVWYHNADDNCYYWSGGIDTVEFVIDNSAIADLGDDAVMQILTEARNYFWNKFSSGLAGIGIYNNDGYILSFQFEQGCLPDNPPEGTVSFKGFSIPVSVKDAVIGAFTQPYPGTDTPRRISGSISAETQFLIGTCGIKVKSTIKGNNTAYILTNYHVAASRPLILKQYAYPYPNSDDIPCVMPAWSYAATAANEIGTLSQGLFNEWHDIAIVQLNSTNSVVNNTFNEVTVLESLDIFNKTSYQGKAVTMYGSMSRDQTSTIKSVSAAQNFRYNGITFKKSDLIQTGQMSQPGDSGAPVLLDGKLIGIILGDDTESTYILPIQRILNYFNLSL